MRPGITLAIIVKDNAAGLRRCLESARDAVQEVVVVDTGSTDGTQEVARSFGTRLIERPWPGAFDVAVNWALEAVETEWTLRLDSDEWLTPDAKPALEAAIANEDAIAYRVIIENLDPAGRVSESRILRLGRTHPKMRVRGVIHERVPQEVLAEIAGSRRVFDAPIRIKHDGYTGGLTPEKLRRNLELLEKELALRPGQIYYEIERAGTLLELRDPRGAAAVNAIADRLIAMQEEDEAPTSVAAALLVQALGLVPEGALNDPRTFALVRLARGWFPEDPPATWAVAQLELRRGDLRAAFDALIDLEQMSERGHRGIGNFNPAILQEGLWTNLGIVAHQLGRKDVARRNYERLLRTDPNHPVASVNVRQL